MMQPVPISIVVACDDHYCILLAALLKSIELHHVSGEPIDVYLVDDHIGKENKQRLNASGSAGKMTLHYIPIEDALPEGLRLPVVPNSYPLNTYIRLLIPYFLPKEVTRVLFMDVDMIVQEDISKLWHTDTGNFPIGAVPDSITRYVGNLDGGGIPNYKALGMQAQSPYFNALIGDMSTVGNRPLPLYEAKLLTSNEWSWRFLAPSGLTGLWQISRRGRQDMSDRERKKLDNFYARKYSMLFDLKILLKTLPAAFQKENV